MNESRKDELTLHGNADDLAIPGITHENELEEMPMNRGILGIGIMVGGHKSPQSIDCNDVENT